jgi:hypothetical protein
VTLVDILAVVIVVAVRIGLSARYRHIESTVDISEPVPAKDSSVDRARATAAWAEGSRVDWDRHVRPVLAREFTELLRARRDPGGQTQAESQAGERMFGSKLWPWVDPSRPFTAEPHRPGPGREGLTRILDRLERL